MACRQPRHARYSQLHQTGKASGHAASHRPQRFQPPASLRITQPRLQQCRQHPNECLQNIPSRSQNIRHGSIQTHPLPDHTQYLAGLLTVSAQWICVIHRPADSPHNAADSSNREDPYTVNPTSSAPRHRQTSQQPNPSAVKPPAPSRCLQTNAGEDPNAQTVRHRSIQATNKRSCRHLCTTTQRTYLIHTCSDSPSHLRT